MADGGQRLLDVIDDPNALESFLGGLTADAELLPSETVDNVVASLARSLDENDYEVDSPNETLFDTLDSSSNHLTDISRSYVPSDFGHVAVQNDAFTNNLDGFSSNGNNAITIRGNLQHHQQTSEHHQISILESSGCDQFLASSCSTNNNNSTLINSVISAPSISNSTNVTAATNSLKLISASVSNNCDPSKTITNFVQSGQIQLSQNSVSSAPNSLNFTFSQDLQQQQHNKNISVTQNQLNQVASLSSVSVEGQISQNVPSTNSTNNLISVVASANENGVVSTLSNNLSSTNFQIVTNQQSGQAQKAQNVSTHNTSATSSSVSITSNDTVTNNATLSTSTNVVGTATIQPTPQQFVASSSAQQTTASVNQLISGQTVSIPNMTVSASQLLANSQGQNILQQIQSAAAASAGQSYIAMEQPTALIATGPTTFGTNVALVATGGTPAYAVLPTTPQFLTNAIIPQSHTIQTLAKAANGTYFQTTGTPQLVATSNVGALQNVSSTTVTTSSVTTPAVTSVSSSTESTVSSGAGTQQQSLPVSSSASDGVVTQIIQQSQQQITSVSGATGTVAITPQQSFAIGNTASIGQVVVSQVNSLSTMTAPQQTQLAGTIVVNQYGQPMLLPTASTAQAGGLQLILRQQPTQPQVLTIQAPTGAATLSTQATAQTAASAGKPIVRYVSQVPQVAQTSGYGLQQIQTANGPAWVAVRYPAASQASQFGQLQGDSIVTTNQITASGQQQIQIQASQSQQVQLQLQQQQTQQLLQHQAQQSQSQIQVQSGLTTQTTLQTQQGAAQLQIQAQQHQQQLSLQTQTQPQSPQVQLAGQQQGQPQGLQQVQLSQGPISMEAQNASTQQNQQLLLNRPNQSPMLNQATPQQLSREVEQQQISVPDSSSEPPPPKKAKTKSKSSKKKVTLDLEQLLKQSGIMDEDLQDDMSFDFGFGSSMDTQLNGLPASPQIPPAQIPVINTTETPKKSSSKKKSNAKKPPAQPPPPPPVPPPPVASPSAKPAKKRSPPKKKNAPAVATPAPPPPPVLPPPPPPVTTTPKKSRSGGGSKKKSGTPSGNASNEKQKSEPTKTASSKKTAPPKKISSLDTLLATIDAVAAAAGRSSSPLQVTPPPPTPPPPSTTPSRSSSKSSPSPKKKSGGSKSKSKKSTPAPTPVKVETVPLPPPPVISSTKIPPPVSISATSTLPSPSVLPPPPSIAFSQPQPTSIATPSLITAPMSNLLTSTAASLIPPSISSAIPAPRVTGPPNLTNGCTSVTTSQTGLTRVVQTIQLTPQNQQLLQNIHSQIQRLLALPKRSETEQQALHKLQVLQQQVIATGIPVPNPAHLNNLAQSVNVEAISVATPSATVPSFDTATATASSSTAIAPFLFPPESDTYVNPVSSTVVTTAAVLSGLASINNSLTLAKLNSSNSGANHGSPSVVPPSSVTATGAAVAGGGSSTNNGASGIILGSPSVSSTASPDSTSNIANSNNLTLDLCSTDTASPNVINSGGGVGNLPVVVSNVKTDLGHLVTSVSAGASSEEKNKENTHGKGAQSQGMATMSTTVPVSLSTSSSTSVSFSQHLHHVPSTTSFIPSTFSTRPVVDEKKVEEQRLANLKAEEEKRARWKKEEFDMLLQRDQQYVVKPDYEVPFATNKDAVERLMKYHIYRDRNDMDFEEFDAEFDNNSGILLEKFSIMMSKYRNLLLKESTKEVGCAERVMLERMFVSEEKVRLEQDRLSVAQGEILELPHPPESWLPKIKEMVDKEMMEFEPQDPVVSQQVQSAVDSIIGCESNDNSNYMLEEGDKIEYDAFGVPITSSGYAGLSSASSADIDEAVRSILS